MREVQIGFRNVLLFLISMNQYVYVVWAGAFYLVIWLTVWKWYDADAVKT